MHSYNWLCSTKVLITNRDNDVTKTLPKTSYSQKMSNALSDALTKSIDYPKGLAMFVSKKYKRLISSIMLSYDMESTNLKIEVISTHPLSKTDIVYIEDFIKGQLGDGWGEGFEQTPFYQTKTMDYQMYCLYDTLRQV